MCSDDELHKLSVNLTIAYDTTLSSTNIPSYDTYTLNLFEIGLTSNGLFLDVLVFLFCF